MKVALKVVVNVTFILSQRVVTTLSPRLALNLSERIAVNLARGLILRLTVRCCGPVPATVLARSQARRAINLHRRP